MRLVALGLAVLSTLGACTGATPLPPAATSPPPREAGTIAVTALLDLSGGRAPKGDAQRNAMQLWVDQQQARGTTPRVRLRVVDLAGSDARLLLELRHAGGSADADAIVIGVPVQLDDVLLAALALVGRPILFTLPITEPAGRGEGARWAFGLAPPPEAIARLAVSALPALTTPAVVVSDESPLAVRERLALQREFERQQRPAPTLIRASGSERDTVGQQLRPLLTIGAGIYFAGPATPYVAPSRIVPVADPNTSFASFLSYLTDGADAAQLREAAPSARWPGTRTIVGPQPPTGTGTARAEFVRAYGDRHGPPSTHAATAYDALGMLAYAADRAGPDGDRLRDQIEGGTFAGIATTYSFAPARHAGADVGDLALLMWDSGRLALARPALMPSR